MTHLIRDALLRGAIVCASLLIVAYLFFVNTAWGHTVDNAAFSGRLTMARSVVEYDHYILSAVSVAMLSLAALIILIIGTIGALHS
jgi:hypothetical protein